jgi:hypothetical protein
VKQRDIWDIVWLDRQAVKLHPDLLESKLSERNIAPETFLHDFSKRIESIRNGQKDFLFEIRRFLPAEVVKNTLETAEYWDITVTLIKDLYNSSAEYFST